MDLTSSSPEPYGSSDTQPTCWTKECIPEMRGGDDPRSNGVVSIRACWYRVPGRCFEVWCSTILGVACCVHLSPPSCTRQDQEVWVTRLQSYPSWPIHWKSSVSVTHCCVYGSLWCSRLFCEGGLHLCERIGDRSHQHRGWQSLTWGHWCHSNKSQTYQTRDSYQRQASIELAWAINIGQNRKPLPFLHNLAASQKRWSGSGPHLQMSSAA